VVSKFSAGGGYAGVKQRVIDRLEAFYERFSGLIGGADD
jgi:hypothetical protein